MGTVYDQHGQHVHGPQTNIVNEVRLAFERARLPTEDPDQLAKAEELLASLPTDFLPGVACHP